MITSVICRGEQWDVEYRDHGWEPDTNAHDIDWYFVDKDAPKELSAEEEESVYQQLAAIGYDRMEDDVL